MTWGPLLGTSRLDEPGLLEAALDKPDLHWAGLNTPGLGKPGDRSIAMGAAVAGGVRGSGRRLVLVGVGVSHLDSRCSGAAQFGAVLVPTAAVARCLGSARIAPAERAS